MDPTTRSSNGDPVILSARAGGKNDKRQERREARPTGGENDADGDSGNTTSGGAPLARLGRGTGEFLTRGAGPSFCGVYRGPPGRPVEPRNLVIAGSGTPLACRGFRPKKPPVAPGFHAIYFSCRPQNSHSSPFFTSHGRCAGLFLLDPGEYRR